MSSLSISPPPLSLSCTHTYTLSHTLHPFLPTHSRCILSRICTTFTLALHSHTVLSSSLPLSLSPLLHTSTLSALTAIHNGAVDNRCYLLSLSLLNLCTIMPTQWERTGFRASSLGELLINIYIIICECVWFSLCTALVIFCLSECSFVVLRDLWSFMHVLAVLWKIVRFAICSVYGFCAYQWMCACSR